MISYDILRTSALEWMLFVPQSAGGLGLPTAEPFQAAPRMANFAFQAAGQG